MKGTKLWQAPGSPIIQGRSRRQTPFLLTWLWVWLASALMAVLFTVFVPVGSGSSYLHWLFAAVGACVGSFLGVLISRAMGWRFAWAWGIILGVCGAALAVGSTWYVLSVVMVAVGAMA